MRLAHAIFACQIRFLRDEAIRVIFRQPDDKPAQWYTSKPTCSQAKIPYNDNPCIVPAPHPLSITKPNANSSSSHNHASIPLFPEKKKPSIHSPSKSKPAKIQTRSLFTIAAVAPRAFRNKHVFASLDFDLTLKVCCRRLLLQI
jgi:hypothetical protein